MTDMAENPELRGHERGPGAVLAAARAAQNLTVAEVARQLKLSASQVAALEADQFERLPGPVFVRGFVRNYARLLKMDPDRILSMVDDATGHDSPNPMPTARGVPFPSPTVRRGPRMLLLALLAVVALAAYEFYWRDRSLSVPELQQHTAPVSIPVLKETPPPMAPVTASEPAAPAITQAAPMAADQTAQAAPAPTPAQETPAAAPATTGEGELKFVFSRESWVQVRDRDGKTIFTRLNPAGSEQRVAGKPPFKLVIGNAHGVQLSHNDRSVDLQAHVARDDVARLTLK